MVAAILSGGNSVGDIGQKIGEEVGLSQVFIAIDPTKLTSANEIDAIVDKVLAYVKGSEPVKEDGVILYPGESSFKIRKENSEKGIPVVEEIWQSILEM
jgi:3-dehydro-L-gulonate 2-dehydrogenase